MTDVNQFELKSRHRRDRRKRRRETVFSLLGAFVILCSFLVKDVFREQYSERIDGFKAMTSNVQRAGELNGIADEVRSIAFGIPGGVASHLEKQLGDITPGDLIEITASRAENTSAEDRDIFESVPRDWWGQFLKSQDFEKKLDDVVRGRTEVRKAVQDFDLRAPSDGSIDLRDRQLFESASAAQKIAGETLVRAENLHQELVSAASDLIEQCERRYSTLTVGSYVLFALGWTLALIGKLFHIPGLSPE